MNREKDEKFEPNDMNALAFFRLVEEKFQTTLDADMSNEMIARKSTLPEKWHLFLMTFFKFHTQEMSRILNNPSYDVLYAADAHPGLSPGYGLIDEKGPDIAHEINVPYEDFQFYYDCFRKCDFSQRIEVLTVVLKRDE